MRADSVTISTVFIAIATCVNVIVSALQWGAAKKSAAVALSIFQTANRPYVGVEALEFRKNKIKKSAHIEAYIKNSGTAPAEHCEFCWEIYINKVLHPGKDIPSNPGILFPQATTQLKGDLNGPLYYGIISGKTTLEIIVRISYKWQENKDDVHKEKHRYDHTQNAFMNLGIFS
jgi:hypothetical protein